MRGWGPMVPPCCRSLTGQKHKTVCKPAAMPGLTKRGEQGAALQITAAWVGITAPTRSHDGAWGERLQIVALNRIKKKLQGLKQEPSYVSFNSTSGFDSLCYSIPVVFRNNWLPLQSGRSHHVFSSGSHAEREKTRQIWLGHHSICHVKNKQIRFLLQCQKCSVCICRFLVSSQLCGLEMFFAKKNTPLVLRIKRFHLDNSYFCNVTCF